MTNSFTIDSIWRYPVKGLGGESLATTDVLAGRGFADDRRWFLASRDIAPLLSGDDKWRPWNYGYSLKKHARLALLHSSIADDVLTISSATDKICGNANVPADMREVENFLRDFLADDSISLLDCKTHPMWDSDNVHLTLLFAASVAEFSRRINDTLAVQRFRANVVVSGGGAWDEREFSEGGRVSCGTMRLLFIGNVERCAATTINPESATNDINIPQLLVQLYGHNEMGVKCIAECGGNIKIGGVLAHEK